MAERTGERARCKTGLGDQQAAGRFAVETMNETRLLALGVAHHLQHLIDMLRHARTALHGKTRGLVEHHQIVVLEQDHLAQFFEGLRRSFGQLATGLRCIEFQRRNADALSLFKPVLAVGTLAVHAQLAFANDALDVGKTTGPENDARESGPRACCLRRR
jgi:hypothetical protein